MRTDRILFISTIVAVVVSGSLGARQRDDAAPPRPTTVLFLCPHGAAKSILASAYFERLAKERGLNVRVESAGTDPDPTVSPAVAAHLERQGYPAPRSNPRKVNANDLESANVVISIGCDLSGLEAPRGRLVRWDEVPSPSEDLARADEAIRKRVTDLIEELVRSVPKR